MIALVEVELQTNVGEFVAVVDLPPFASPPEIVNWGTRAFIRFDAARGPTGMRVYREAVSWVTLTPSPGKPRPGQACTSKLEQMTGEVSGQRAAGSVIRNSEEAPPVDRSARVVLGDAIEPGVADTADRGDGQQKGYVVLSDTERARGFVRPVRASYVHVGIAGPKYPLRDLTEEEKTWGTEFVKFEVYPPEMRPATGKFWSQADLDRVDKGCQAVTTMGRSIAETYARDPKFYGGTFCATCRVHLSVGADGEFVWDGTTERVGT